MPEARWDILTIGHLSRNKFWGESDDQAYRAPLCTSTLPPRFPAAAWEAEPFGTEVAQHRHRGAMVLEQGKNEPHRLLHLLIRIQHDLATWVMHQPNR